MGEWKETKYGQVPANWNFNDASEYCEKVTDGTHDSPKRQEEGNFLVTSKHIKGRNIDFENAYLISKEDFCKINERSKVDQWDVIISMIGEYCGFAYLERNSKIAYAIKNVGLFKTGDKNNALWLYYYIQSKIGDHYLQTNKSGTSQPYITLGTLRKLPILVPSNIEEQKAIASVLSSLDDKIDLLHRQNKTPEAMAETLFRQWFIEEAKEDWEEGDLSYFAENPRNSVKPIDIESGTTYIGLEHIDRRNISLTQSGSVSEVTSNKYQFAENDILFGKLRPYFHKVCFAPYEGVCSTDILVIRPKRLYYFAYCLFAFFQDDVVEHSTLGSEGTRMPRTNWEILSQYSVKIPDEETLKRFNKLIDPSIEKIKQNQTQIRTLEKLRDTLLPKLMSGEVRVKA